jgi:hypothetical protein
MLRRVPDRSDRAWGGWAAVALLAAILLSPGVGATAQADASDAGPVLLDEIVAVVDDAAILWSDLFLEARFLALKRDGAAGFLATPSPKLLKAALDHIIDERVVHQEAERLQVFVVAPVEVDQAVREVRAQVGAKAYDNFMTEKQIDDATVREIIARGMRVRRYLDGRFRLNAKPKETDIAALYEAHREEFGKQTLEQAKDAIRERLTRDKMDRLTAEFTADVRRRAHIRLLHDPEKPALELRLSGSGSAPAGGERGE